MIERYRDLHATHYRTTGQHGQALIEGLITLLGLLSLWAAISWLGRLQDMALQADHASRHAAFALTRQSAPDMQAHQIVLPYLYSSLHRWNDAAGRSLQEHEQFHAQWAVDRDRQLGIAGQVGGYQQQAARLRRDWRMHDDGIYRSNVTVSPGSQQANASYTAWWRFSLAYPIVSRSTSILAGAGHGADDSDAQAVMGSSSLAWSANATNAYRLAGSITDIMQFVDDPWRRASPASDWLAPWADLTPGVRTSLMPLSANGEQP